MRRETTPDVVATPVISRPLEGLAAEGGDAIQLESCAELEWIVVTTRRSVYDLVVLSGESGEVMLRGGQFFPEFTRMRVVGSVFGGTAVKVRSISVGLHLELRVDGQSFVTSRIQAVSRHRFPVTEGRA